MSVAARILDGVTADVLRELKNLWRVSFGDGAEYTDFYFRSRFRPENTCVVSEGGRVVSAAQFFPYAVSHNAQVLTGVYILGVCTHPEHRNRGYSRAVISTILAEQYARGAELAFLIPAEPYLFGVYAKLGFAPLFTVYETGAQAAAGQWEHPAAYGIECVDAAAVAFEDVFAYYDGFCRALPGAALKSCDDFLFAMDELAAAEGRAAVCVRDGRVCGFAVAEGDTVKELLCAEDAVRGALIRYLYPGAGPRAVRSPNPFPGAIKRTLGMARVLRPAEFLRKTVKEPVTVSLTDSVLTQNTGVYRTNGTSPQNAAPVDITLDISELAPRFMMDAYANWLLN